MDAPKSGSLKACHVRLRKVNSSTHGLRLYTRGRLAQSDVLSITAQMLVVAKWDTLENTSNLASKNVLLLLRFHTPRKRKAAYSACEQDTAVLDNLSLEEEALARNSDLFS